MQGNLGFPDAAKQMRRLAGPCGGAARQCVLVAADMYAPPEEDATSTVWVAHREAKKNGEKKKRMENRGKI